MCYLSSRWQPTSASSRFSLSNHFPSSAGSHSHAVHLRVLPPTQLRRRGAIRYPVYIYHSSDTPTFGCSTPHIHNISISYLALIRPKSCLRHSLHLTLINSDTPNIGSSRTSSAPHIHNHTISIRYLALLQPNSFLRHSHQLTLNYKGHISNPFLLGLGRRSQVTPP